MRLKPIQEIDCKVNENGVCGLHNVEVERRKNTENLLNSLPMWLTVILFIMGGAFIYSNESHKKIDKLTLMVGEIKANVSTLEAQIEALTRELERQNRIRKQVWPE